MANALYDAGRENILGGDIDWDAATIGLIGIDENDDAVDLATDNALDDIAGGARVFSYSSGLASKTKTAGVADAADVTIPTVSGDQFESVSLYKHTGTESTSLLIGNIDTATGLPLTPNGADIDITWDNGANKIFKL